MNPKKKPVWQEDEIMEELWAISAGIAKECGNDPGRIFERYREAQKKSKRPVVSRAHLRTKQAATH